jgi:hypothetical protein
MKFTVEWNDKALVGMWFVGIPLRKVCMLAPLWTGVLH